MRVKTIYTEHNLDRVVEMRKAGAVARMMDAKDILKWVAKKHLTGDMAYLAPEIDSIVKRIVDVAADVQLWTK